MQANAGMSHGRLPQQYAAYAECCPQVVKCRYPRAFTCRQLALREDEQQPLEASRCARSRVEQHRTRVYAQAQVP